jgi:hypothetical protein
VNPPIEALRADGGPAVCWWQGGEQQRVDGGRQTGLMGQRTGTKQITESSKKIAGLKYRTLPIDVMGSIIFGYIWCVQVQG